MSPWKMCSRPTGRTLRRCTALPCVRTVIPALYIVNSDSRISRICLNESRLKCSLYFRQAILKVAAITEIPELQHQKFYNFNFRKSRTTTTLLEIPELQLHPRGTQRLQFSVHFASSSSLVFRKTHLLQLQKIQNLNYNYRRSTSRTSP